MAISKEILATIDAEISRLKQVRALLAEGEDTPVRKKPGPKAGTKRKPLSPEGRARIAAAQKKRWAKRK